ncbi:MAG: biotin/lipoyl-binding protein [Chitinivibrionales bacterium]|nr:biotin/lipoyl-binding protein [Chitinivibrionales bacterium]MBD3394797.1 biotin/lipoyl-binding protein [Chitinivibrionales bacterium]
MATPIVMPQVGHDIETGKILEWKVKVGDTVSKGDIVAVVESEKASFEVEAFESGTLIKIVHAADAEVKVFDPIAYLGEPGESIGGNGKDPGPAKDAGAQEPASKKAASVSGNKAAAVPMPQVGHDIETGTVLEWKVKEGDPVKKGDIVAVVESEKASFEVEVYQSGTILKIVHAEGDEVRVFSPLAYVGNPGDVIEEGGAQGPAHAALEKEEAAAAPASAASPAVPAARRGGQKLIASPSAKRIARERGMDLAAIAGTGPGGRIVKRDVVGAAPSAPPAPAAAAPVSPAITPSPGDEVMAFSKMRQGIARNLTLSKQTIPHFYLFVDVDMTHAMTWRKAFNEARGSRITVTDIIVMATAQALREFPQLNSHVDAAKMVLKKDINIGIAVSVEAGLLVPTIPDVDRKDLFEISAAVKANAEAAKRGVIKLPKPGTFTISNLGMFSVGKFLPIINPPECAIMGVASAEKRVVYAGHNSMMIRDMMTLSLACDHRATDGTYAAQFLNRIKERIENFTA